MPAIGEGKGLMAPQNNFLDKISKRFKGTHANFVLGNASLPPNYPIVYCSDGFCELTGLSRASVMREPVSCPFLFGPNTTQKDRDEIDRALDEKSDLKLQLQLYTCDGISFWCLLDIIPIRNEAGEVVLFLVSHKDISDRYSSSRNLSTYSNDSKSETVENMEFLYHLDNAYARRRSRAVLNDISGAYVHSNVNNKWRRKRSYSPFIRTASAPIYKPVKLEETCAILPHYGTFRKVWDVVILVAIMYVAVIVPYNAAFNRLEEECTRTNLKPSIASDIFVEMLFILDIIFNFRMTFVNLKGEVVFNPRDIAINYISGWFTLDLLAALPFDLLYATCSIDNMDNFTSVDILKLTRLVRLARFLQKMERFSQYSAVVLTLLMIFFGFIAHWLACVWYVIGLHQTSDTSAGWMEQLAIQYQLENKTSLPQIDSYITALYFTSTSLTTVGFGNISGNTRWEKIFSIFLMFIGALMHATIFGNVASIVARIYSRRLDYDRKMLDLDHFAKINKLPKEIKHRMEDHLQTKWFVNNGVNYEITEEYPKDLQGDICLHLHKQILELPMFEFLPMCAKKKIGMITETLYAGPSEHIIHRDDVLRSVWYVCSGSMEVLDHEVVVAILGHGDLVGCDLDHIEMNTGREVVIQSDYDVKALTYCELKRLDLVKLAEIANRLSDSTMLKSVSDGLKSELTFGLKGERKQLVRHATQYSRIMWHKETQTESEFPPSLDLKEIVTNHKQEIMDLLLVEERNQLRLTLPSSNTTSPTSPGPLKVSFQLDDTIYGSSSSLNGKDHCQPHPLKTILRQANKSRSFSLDPGEGSHNPQEHQFGLKGIISRSHSLSDSRERLHNHKILGEKGQKGIRTDSPLLKRNVSRLQKFQAKFSKKSLSFEDESSLGIYKIPEIRLEIPEEELGSSPALHSDSCQDEDNLDAPSVENHVTRGCPSHLSFGSINSLSEGKEKEEAREAEKECDHVDFIDS